MFLRYKVTSSAVTLKFLFQVTFKFNWWPSGVISGEVHVKILL